MEPIAASHGIVVGDVPASHGTSTSQALLPFLGGRSLRRLCRRGRRRADDLNADSVDMGRHEIELASDNDSLPFEPVSDCFVFELTST